MALNGFTRNFRPLEVLTEEQIEDVHRGTLEVLWTTGFRMEHERALKLMEQNDCKVDYDEMRVRIPPALVEECLRKTPSIFPVRARDSNKDVTIGGNVLCFTSAPGMQTVNLDTWEPQEPTRKEEYDAIAVLDALPTCHLHAPYSPYFGFQGVPPAMVLPETLAARLRNSTKPSLIGHSHDSEIFAMQMAQAAGTEVMCGCYLAPPLTGYRDAFESVFRCAEAGLSIKILSGEVMGGTAPTTIAGGLVSNLVEVIAALVLTQLVRPGTRVIVKDFSFAMNMETGSPLFGSIESALHNVAFAQYFRKWGVPVDGCTAYPNAKKPDYQGGYEKAIRALVAGLSGVSTLLLHGSVHGELTHHPVQSVLDNDVAGMVGRFMEGISVNDETLAVRLIQEVGPIPGHYLSKAHTRKWWKLEEFIPKAADRLTYPAWIQIGKKSSFELARERTEEILATHKPTPLSSSQEEELERILEEARKYYKRKGLISQEEMARYRDSMKSANYPYE